MDFKILVTGGAGFIGSNFIRIALQSDKYKIVNYDKLTYAGNLENLKDIENHPHYAFYRGDITDYDLLKEICSKEKINTIINFAAETHVDRSIQNSYPFIQTNIVGTQTLLEIALELRLYKFIQISTDEVYGSLGDSGLFVENSNLKPNSPYSASKASADLIVRAYYKTYNIPAIITRCSNNYGPFQFPEKLIPLIILNAMQMKKIPVYGDGKNIRDWIYVDDHCYAILDILNKGNVGEIYNIGANCEKQNIDIVRLILNIMGIDHSLIEFVDDRPAHDRRYAIDSSKINNKIGWHPKMDFEQGIEKTIDWYQSNQDWINHILSKDYYEYYRKQYGKTK